MRVFISHMHDCLNDNIHMLLAKHMINIVYMSFGWKGRSTSHPQIITRFLAACDSEHPKYTVQICSNAVHNAKGTRRQSVTQNAKTHHMIYIVVSHSPARLGLKSVGI